MHHIYPSNHPTATNIATLSSVHYQEDGRYDNNTTPLSDDNIANVKRAMGPITKTTNIEEEKQSIIQDDVWSDDIISKDFLAWLEENHRLGDPYQRAKNNCIRLITGKGIPKSLLTPRRRFCCGIPLASLRLDWSSIESSALNIANIYGGPAASDGGLLWCVQRLRSYSDTEHQVRIQGRRKCFYSFLCCTRNKGSDVSVLAEQRGIIHLIADFVGISSTAMVCSDSASGCVFSSCQVTKLPVKMVKSKRTKVMTV